MNNDLNNGQLHKFNTTTGGEVIIVQISSYTQDISEEVRATFKEGHSYERMLQLACSGKIVAQRFGLDVELKRTEQGAPFLSGTNHHISISHTDDYMAVYLHPDTAVAIDIEVLGRDISLIRSRYALDHEVSLLEQTKFSEPLLTLWSIKECLFKVIPVAQVLFKEHLILQNTARTDDGLKSSANVDHPSFSNSYSIVSRIFEPLIVSYTE